MASITTYTAQPVPAETLTFQHCVEGGRPPIEITPVALEPVTLMTEYQCDGEETAPARTGSARTFKLVTPPDRTPYPMNIDDLFQGVPQEVKQPAAVESGAPAQRRLSRSAVGAVSCVATAALTLFSASILRVQAMYGSFIRF